MSSDENQDETTASAGKTSQTCGSSKATKAATGTKLHLSLHKSSEHIKETERQIIQSIDARAKQDPALYADVVKFLKDEDIGKCDRWSGTRMAKWFKQQQKQQNFKDKPPPLVVLLAVLAAREVLPHHKRDQLQLLIEDRQWDQWLNNTLNKLGEASSGPGSSGGENDGTEKVKVKFEATQTKCFPGFDDQGERVTAQFQATSTTSNDSRTETMRPSIEHQDHCCQNALGKRPLHGPCDGYHDGDNMKRAKVEQHIFAPQMAAPTTTINVVDHAKILAAVSTVIQDSISKQTRELHEVIPNLVKDALRHGSVKDTIHQAISEEFKTLKEITDSAMVQRNAAIDNTPPRVPYRYPEERRAEPPQASYTPFITQDSGVYEEIRRYPARTAGGVLERIWR